MRTWLLGQRGFLGSCLARGICEDTSPSRIELFANLDSSIPDFDETAIKAYADAVNGEEWQIVWMAGGSGPHSKSGISTDASVFDQFLEYAERYLPLSRGRILFASSAGITLPSIAGGSDLQSLKPTTNAYLSMKVAQEASLSALAEFGVDVRILRISSVYGPRCSETGRINLIETLVRNAIQGDVTELFVPMSLRRDFVFNKDLITILLTDLKENRLPARVQTQLVASGVSFTIRQVVECVESVLGLNVPIMIVPNPDADLRDHTFEPDIVVWKTPLRQGISATVQQFMKS